ncbi:MAG TPA: 4-(cytidine 5'-diphospho)-2-C-methyl-D-erythritol kinase [Phnomibacter sp.]|nr:4-(cytidine 5'-diphospho)-2-C-methyl-D-erythritol kinase [Phnomibacter sp.]
MVSFSPCKINIGLCITGKRADGYHNLETVFYPVPVHEALEMLPAGNQLQFTQTGIPLPGQPDANLCVKAWRLLKTHFPQLPDGLHMHLHKAIPAGAGLGAGSANAAHTLLLANKLFGLALSTQTLLNLALELGSDCPIFIENAPCFAQGRGEILEPLPPFLKGHWLVLVNPGIHVSTAWAFSQIIPAPPAINLAEAVMQPINHWPHLIYNQFENPVIAQWPPVGAIKQALLNQGALYAAMSGSGSTVYGIFKEQPTLPPQLFESQYWVRQVRL